MPIKFIIGAQDRTCIFTNDTRSVLRRLLPAAAVVTYKNAGHTVLCEEAIQVHSEMLALLQQPGA
jgi:pimeloyl-ACP methyl ester carboxylesterase